MWHCSWKDVWSSTLKNHFAQGKVMSCYAFSESKHIFTLTRLQFERMPLRYRRPQKLRLLVFGNIPSSVEVLDTTFPLRISSLYFSYLLPQRRWKGAWKLIMAVRMTIKIEALISFHEECGMISGKAAYTASSHVSCADFILSFCQSSYFHHTLKRNTKR